MVSISGAVVLHVNSPFHIPLKTFGAAAPTCRRVGGVIWRIVAPAILNILPPPPPAILLICRDLLH